MTNYWSQGSIPYSWYQKNVTLDWSGSDDTRSADPNWGHGKITYKYNAQGFRTYDLVSLYGQDVNLALGCSFTEGIGLPIELCWPTIIEQETSLPMLNLGLGSGSTDTVARILSNVVTMFNIKTVYILWPSANRFELYEPNQIVPLIPSSSRVEYTWNIDQFNSAQRFFKNKQIVNLLSSSFGFKTIEQDISDCREWVVPNDLARDQQHHGVQSHQNLAKLFLNH